MKEFKLVNSMSINKLPTTHYKLPTRGMFFVLLFFVAGGIFIPIVGKAVLFGSFPQPGLA